MKGAISGTRSLIRIMKDGEYKVVGGQLSHNDTFNTALINITNRAAHRYRELHDGDGLQSRNITLNCVFSSDEMFLYLRQLAFDLAPAQLSITRCGTGMEDLIGGIVTNFTETAKMEDKLTASFTIQSSGDFNFPTEFSGAPPCITKQPQDRLVIGGRTIQLQSMAINWNTVQWYFQGLLDTEFQLMVGDTMPTVTLEDVRSDKAGHYYAEYCNAHGCTQTRHAFVEVVIDETAQSDIYPPAEIGEAKLESRYTLPHFNVWETAVPYITSQSMDVITEYSIPHFNIEEAVVEYYPHETQHLDSNYSIPSFLLQDVVIEYNEQELTNINGNYSIIILSKFNGIPYADNESEMIIPTYSIQEFTVT